MKIKCNWTENEQKRKWSLNLDNCFATITFMIPTDSFIVERQYVDLIRETEFTSQEKM